MNKYIIKKYVIAENFQKALKLEKTTEIHDIVLDSASEPQAVATHLIGFDTSGSEHYYSPVMKKNKKK